MQPETISRYTITRELGKGSMGVVYEGQPGDGGEAVAIKVFFPDSRINPEEISTLLDRFEREGSALSHITHPNVVRVLEVGGQDGMEFIVMEKLQGYNLKELAALGTRFTLAETIEIMLQLLNGLTACHAQQIIHRDVKPANVVRDETGRIRLTDFGIARIITDQTLSRQGTIVGTPNYMSPEQVKGQEVDARTDIFSCGVLLYELVTAKKPFDGPDMTSIMYNVVNVHPPHPRFYNGALPEEIDQVCFKAMAKDAAERYASADEFATALRDLEQALHYREGTEAFLNALPASPDPDSSADSAVSQRQQPVAGTSPGAAGAAAVPDPFAGVGTIAPGKVFCVDCGLENREDQEFCTRCMRPLLKRDTIARLAADRARSMHRLNRGDHLFITCLSVVMVLVVILILYLFFRGVV